MSGTCPSTPLARRADHGRSPGSRPRRLLRWGGAVALLAVAALLAAALIPGSHATGSDGLAAHAVATGRSGARAAHPRGTVFGSRIAANRYGTKISQLENGTNSRGQLVSDLSPLKPAQFDRPVARYKRYAEGWAVRLGHDLTPLTAALRAGDRTAARRDWMTAFSDYLHLGAVYGLLPGDLDDELARVPSSTSDTHFPGLHRIEKGLWTGEKLSTLVPVATALSAAAVRLQRRLPSVQIDPQDYTARASEILEDAQRDLMSGTQVPWSGAGVLGTEAGLVATERVVHTLIPLLNGRENTEGQVQVWLIRLRRALASVRRPDGSYPALHQLSSAQLQRIDGTLAGAVGALSEVSATLETKDPPNFGSIPEHRAGK